MSKYRAKLMSSTPGLALLALGVVFGDIGTSPLYTLQAVFSPSYGMPLTINNILGGCSSIFWVLMLVVTLKYVTFILCATNKGEGGIMAMLALVSSILQKKPRLCSIVTTLGLLGAALFYGDAVITPAISVLSAVEGLSIESSAFAPYTVIIAVVIIIGLFSFQHYGTNWLGHLFSPICILWFLAIAAVGLWNIVRFPRVLQALNPWYAFDFLTTHGLASFFVIGAVLLAFTGAEALYADVGHFGRKAIRLAWYMIFPTLVLSYFGQGALLIENPSALSNPFYLACPSWAVYPMVVIATLATIIASQAVISGAYSITWQAVQLNYLPRIKIIHTSIQEMGQIYIPVVNWILFMAVLGTIIGFGSAERLATAYGVAVSGTMLMTTLLAFFVVRYDWKYPLWWSICIIGFFGSMDIIFFSSSLLKIFHGGWFPLTLGMMMFIMMKTWHKGRHIVMSHRDDKVNNLLNFLKTILATPPQRIPGTAVFFAQHTNTVPHTFLYHLKHKIMHQHVVFLTLREEEVPLIHENDRVQISMIQKNCYSVVMRFGFKNVPNIPKALDLCIAQGYTFLSGDRSFFLNNETFTLNPSMKHMMSWRKRLFTFLAHNQRNVGEYFHLPGDEVVQLGSKIEI